MEESRWLWMVWFLVAIELAIVWITNHFGLWYVAFVVGAANGAVMDKTKNAFISTWLATVLGWALPLVWQSLFYPIGATAASVAGMMGFGHQGVLVVIVTILLPFLLGTTGIWLCRAFLKKRPVVTTPT